MGKEMAGKTTKGSTVGKKSINSKKGCDRHAKSNSSTNKTSKNYVKKYRGQGRP
jgi:hypothetical protein